MNSIKKPSTFEDTIELLDNLLSEDDKIDLYKMEENDIGKLHFSLGLWIRNNWIYNEGSPLGVYINEKFPLSIDDCSDAIITFYHRTCIKNRLRLRRRLKGLRGGNWGGRR